MGSAPRLPLDGLAVVAIEQAVATRVRTRRQVIRPARDESAKHEVSCTVMSGNTWRPSGT